MAFSKGDDDAYSPSKKERAPKKKIVDPEDEEEDDDDGGSSIHEADGTCCRSSWARFLVRKLRLGKLYTDYTPLLMWLTVTVASIVLAVQRIVKESNPRSVLPYALYVLISICIFSIWLLARAVWIISIARRITESRAFVALNAVLDPELVHLCATVSICLFWAYIPATGFQPEEKQVSVLGIGVIPVDDIQTLLKINLLLILWAAKDLLLSVLVFYFLTGLLMTLNPNIVKFLTMYRLLRKLNTNWSRVRPILGLSHHPSSDQTAAETAPKGGRKLSTQSNHISIIDTPGLKRLLSHEPARRPSDAKSQRTIDIGVNGRMLQKHLKAKAEVRKDPERYTPSVLLKKNIDKTRTNAVANLLALEYCRQSPPVMYLHGRRTQLLHQKDTKQAARELFDHFIEFRNSVSPEEKSQLERGAMASQVLNELQKVAQTGRAPLTAHQGRASEARDGFTRPNSGTGGVSGEAGPKASAALKDLSADELERFTASVATAESHHRKPNTASHLGLSVISEHSEVSKSPAPEFQPAAKHSHRPPFESQFITEAPSLLVDKWEFSDVSSVGSGLESCLSEVQDVRHLDEVSPYLWRTDPLTQAVLPSKDNVLDASLQQQPTAKADAQGATTALTEQLPLLSPDDSGLSLPAVYLPESFMEALLDRDTAEFMSYADPGGRGYVSRRNFRKMCVEMYRLRKQLLHLVMSQELIRKIVSRIISALLIFLSILLFLLITGVSAETIIISGAAVLSSCTVILSFFYTGLVHAIIFVCFLNPYNVDDRVVMNDTLRVVKKIHTYFTEFFTVHGKVETINHSALFDTPLCNESRAKNGGIYLEFFVDYSTPQSKCQALNYQVENFVQNHQEFVKDSFFFYIEKIVIGDYKQMVYFVTVVDSWGLFRSVWHSRGVLLRFIVQQCDALGINYRLPLKPIRKID